MFYLKSRATFAGARMLRESDAAVVLESYGDDKTTLVTEYGAAGQDDIGAWAIRDGQLFLVSGVKPADDRSKTTITCREPMAVFDRDVYYASSYAGLSTGALIAKIFEDEFIRQPDGFYALPTLTVRDWTSLAQVPPADEPAGKTFSLYKYLQTLREAYGVFVDMSFAGDSIFADIRQRITLRHNVFIGDGHATLTSREFGGADTVAKVTTVRNGTRSDWYLTRFGEITQTPPTPRVPGKWVTLALGDNDDAEQKAQEAFGKKAGTNKVEFRCDRDFALGDEIALRTDAELVTGRISYKGLRFGDAQITYRIGDLAVTLTEKMQRRS